MAGDGLIDLQQSVSFSILPAWKARYAPVVRTNREHWFAFCLTHRRQPRLHAGEHTDYRWLPHEQAERLATSWSNRDAIRYLFRQGWGPCRVHDV
jgi:dATP pyrophosphohydrolase